MGIATVLHDAEIHCGCPEGSNRLIATAEPSDESSTTRTVTQTVPSMGANAAAQRPSSAHGASQTPAAIGVGRLLDQEPGFYIVPKSMTREALESTLFHTRAPAAMSKYRGLNPNSGDVKAGSMIVLGDPSNTSCTYQEAQLMQAAQQVDAYLAPLTPDEADFLQRHGAEIAGFIGHTSTWLGVSAMVMEAHLANLRDTLQAIERLHQDSYRQHGHLKSPQFFAERQRLLAQLDAHLLNSTRLRGQTTLGDHPKLKTALGLSTRSLVHHWDKAGAPGQIPGYSAHVEAVSRAMRYMKAGGYIGIGLGGVSSLLAIEEVCRGDSAAACEKVKYSEAGKFGSSTVGGAFGGWVGLKASAPLCLALGVSTGVGGVACVAAIVGVGVWVGTTGGGKAGEGMGEKMYEVTHP
jgi:hypothetical protein